MPSHSNKPENPLELYRQVSTDEAAKFLNLSTRKLEKMRREGDGPRFVRISRKCVRYPVAYLLEYQAAHTATNTYQTA